LRSDLKKGKTENNFVRTLSSEQFRDTEELKVTLR
jgi:hypothetical protein